MPSRGSSDGDTNSHPMLGKKSYSKLTRGVIVHPHDEVEVSDTQRVNGGEGQLDTIAVMEEVLDLYNKVSTREGARIGD